MADDKKKGMDPASLKVLDDAMSAFTKGVDAYRKGVDDGTIETLHDVMPIEPSRADAHLEDAPGFVVDELGFPSMSSIGHRVSEAVELGGGEGFGLSTAKFDGKLAVIVDQGGMADLIDDEDADLLQTLVKVMLFDSEADRTGYLDGLKFHRFARD